MVPRNCLLLIAAVVVGIVPLFYSFSENAEFAGADDQAKVLIQTIKPDYQPWVSAIWEPPSSEVASLLFALQAAFGAGFLGYYLGLRRGQKNSDSSERADAPPEQRGTVPRSHAAR
jgi:cobalt/nickel transport protein